MEKRKRPVEFTTGHAQTRIEAEQLEKHKGLFHQWGVESEEHETNFGVWTVGIIEDENGQVHNVPPHRIKFLDR